MDFAVVKIAGKQYLVSDGEVISVQANLGKAGDKVILSEVLLQSTGDKVEIGQPLIANAKVFGEVVFSGKGEKLHIFKFKAKSRYRRTIGFRPALTKVKISLSPAKAVKKTVKK